MERTITGLPFFCLVTECVTVKTTEIAKTKKLLETHTVAKSSLHSCLNARKSAELLVAFDVFLTLYKRYPA